MKTFCKLFDIVAPSNFRRRTVLAAMQQDEFGSAAGFEKMRLDVADKYSAVLISGYRSSSSKYRTSGVGVNDRV
jgi:hypothetical protein